MGKEHSSCSSRLVGGRSVGRRTPITKYSSSKQLLFRVCLLRTYISYRNSLPRSRTTNYVRSHLSLHTFTTSSPLPQMTHPRPPEQQTMQVTRQNLQLVGVTAMLLASKYEEIYPPQIRDLVFITDRAYNRDQILEMESTMANALEFRLTVPTIYCFLLRYLKVILCPD